MTVRTLVTIGFLAGLGLVAFGCGKKGGGGGKSGGEGSGMRDGEGGRRGMGDGKGDRGDPGAGAGAAAGKGAAKKLTQEDLEKLLKVEVPGFQQSPGAKIMDVFGPLVTVYYRGTQGNAQDMTAEAQVRIHTCGNCPPLDAAGFKANQALFEKMMLPAAHKENKDAVFDIQEETLEGRKVVSIYQLSFAVSADGKSRASSHAYSLYHHNGVNLLHVMVYPRSVKGYKSTESLEDLKKQLTREELVAAAKVFLGTLGGKLF